MAKKSMALVKYHLPIVWNKYLLTKNIWYRKIIFSFVTPTLSLKLPFMSGKGRVSLNIFTRAYFTNLLSAAPARSVLFEK